MKIGNLVEGQEVEFVACLVLYILYRVVFGYGTKKERKLISRKRREETRLQRGGPHRKRQT